MWFELWIKVFYKIRVNEAFPNGGKGGIDFFPQGERLSPREKTTFSTQGAKPRGWKQFLSSRGLGCALNTDMGHTGHTGHIDFSPENGLFGLQ